MGNFTFRGVVDVNVNFLKTEDFIFKVFYRVFRQISVCVTSFVSVIRFAAVYSVPLQSV